MGAVVLRVVFVLGSLAAFVYSMALTTGWAAMLMFVSALLLFALALGDWE